MNIRCEVNRYYEIQRKLHESRELPPLPDDNPLLSKPFNREWEEERKQQMLAASQRCKQEELEEAEVLDKARKIEAALKRKRMAEKSSSRSRDKGGHMPNKKPVLPVGGVVLRSVMSERGAAEPHNAAAILDAIGFQLPVACHDPDVCAAVSSLVKDLNTLLSWHQRAVAAVDTKKLKGSSSGNGAAFTASPLPSPMAKSDGMLASGEDDERSAKKARKS